MFEQQLTAYLQSYSPNTAALEKLTGRIAARLEGEPCLPPANIAGQALDAARWADDAACEKYAALLAASMDPERQKTVHPAFPSIISQIDSIEDAFLCQLQKRQAIPAADCYLCRMRKGGNFASRPVESGTGAVKLIARMTDFLPEDGDYARVQAAIDNLLRLQLIELRMHAERISLEEIQEDAFETLYMLFEQVIAQTAQDIREHVSGYQDAQLRLHPGSIVLTEFGRRFVQTCLV
ncbi:MAG: Abi-alpha family protein [Eubacteriales bacterium]|nr:Abi-alpha family protein [Eubacteriales bacterium]